MEAKAPFISHMCLAALEIHTLRISLTCMNASLRPRLENKRRTRDPFTLCALHEVLTKILEHTTNPPLQRYRASLLATARCPSISCLSTNDIRTPRQPRHGLTTLGWWTARGRENDCGAIIMLTCMRPFNLGLSPLIPNRALSRTFGNQRAGFETHGAELFGHGPSTALYVRLRAR